MKEKFKMSPETKAKVAKAALQVGTMIVVGVTTQLIVAGTIYGIKHIADSAAQKITN